MSADGSAESVKKEEKRPKKNCCGWKVATVFLFCVALSLIVTGVLLPVEDIIISYLPKFDEPANPYTGPEAGSEADRKSPLPGTTGNGIADGLPPPPAAGGDSSIGTVVPKFMACPTDASLCCMDRP